MASILRPAVELIGTRLLAALGVGVAAGTAGEAARQTAQKRSEEADKAKSMPIARSEAQTKEKEKCKDCPIPKGAPFNRTFPERKPWVDYQARIGGLPSGPGFITEWIYNGVEFDGFDLSQCLLKEAKAGYDRFFDEWGRPKKWWAYNVEGMIEQVVSQDLAATPTPPVRLEWFWQEPSSYGYFTKILSRAAPRVFHHYQP